MDPAESAGLRHLFFSFGGLFLLDFDASHKLINTTEGGDRFVTDNYKSGFRYQQTVSSGLGWEIPFHVTLPVGVSIGLDLLAGTNASFDRYAKSPEAARRMGEPSLPVRASDLKSWTVGDNVMYLARGGVGFAAGVGIPPLVGAAAFYFMEGDWFVYVEKTDATHAYVKVTNTKATSAGALASAAIVGISVAKFAQVDRTFSFVYDLNNYQARHAYEDALHGSLSPSQRIADNKLGGVERVFSAIDNSYGTMGSWYFGLPLFSTVGGKSGDVFNTEKFVNHKDGSRSLVHTGIFIDHEYTAGWLSKHKRHINDFFATAYTRTDDKGVSTQGYSGQYLWAFESDRVSADKLREELDELAAKTGLASVRSIRTPSDGRMGYLNIKFTAELSQQAVDALMAWATRAPQSLVSALSNNSSAAVESYFSGAVADAASVCADGSDEKALADLVACKAQLVEKTRAANNSMIEELRAMARAKGTNQKEFALHFGRFGKGMATNQFTFRSLLQLTRGAPPKITLTMEGERISRFKKVISASSFAIQ